MFLKRADLQESESNLFDLEGIIDDGKANNSLLITEEKKTFLERVHKYAKVMSIPLLVGLAGCFGSGEATPQPDLTSQTTQLSPTSPPSTPSISVIISPLSDDTYGTLLSPSSGLPYPDIFKYKLRDPFASESDIGEFKSKIKSKYELNVELKPLAVLYIDNHPEIVALNFNLFTKGELSALEESIEAFPFCSRQVENLVFEKLFIDGAPYSIRSLFYGDTMVITLDVAPGLPSIGIASPISKDLVEYRNAGIKTNADLLKFNYGRECGNVVSDAILRAANTPEIYDKIVNPDKSIKKGVNMVFDPDARFIDESLSSQIRYNPLYGPFAELEGWEKLDSNNLFIYGNKNPDPRTSNRAADFDIGVLFNELFPLYKINPSILSQEEIYFFGKIDRMFGTNPIDAAKKIAENPKVLLLRYSF